MKPLTRHTVIRLCLGEAERRGWPADFTADVILAQLAMARRKAGIFGPCAYCGSWIASTVDHITPWSRGGTEAADNLASACLTCNSAKGAQTADEWLGGMVGASCLLTDSPAHKAEIRAKTERRSREFAEAVQVIRVRRGFTTTH